MTDIRAREERSQTPGSRRRVWAIIASHSVVDFFSYLIVPLMPLLVTRLDLSNTEKAWILAVGSVCSGLVQPLVAWLSDKLSTRWLGTLGLLLGAIATSLIGHAQSFEQLLVIQVLSSLGIGAFHPVAAAAVGQLSAPRRSLGVSLFFLGGMAGGISGNLSATPYAQALGITSFAYLIAPGVLFTILLWAAFHRVPHHHAQARTTHAQLDELERRQRWRAVWVLYVGNVIRFTVNSALVYLVIDWTIRLTAERQGAMWDTLDAQARNAFGLQASGINGWLQASMQIGMGVMGLLAARIIRPGQEKGLIVWMPILGALPIFLVPWAQGAFEHEGSRWLTVPIVFVLCVLAGVGFGGIVPVTISLAQRMLPHRTTLASGLMMGGAWFMAFLGPIIGKYYTQWFGPAGAWHAVGVMLLVAGVLSVVIPGWLVRRVAH